jgi:hypothetical protein
MPETNAVIDVITEYVVCLTSCAVPTEEQQIPPKSYYETAIKYFKDIKNHKADMPSEIETAEKLDDCIKNTMIKYLLYEKAIQDLIQQGIKPVVDENETFLVVGWNCCELPVE